jgi:predicted thioredoxin/glutaredoxin
LAALVAQGSLALAAAVVVRECASQAEVQATTEAQASRVVMAAMQLVLQAQAAAAAAALSSERPLAACLAML